MSATGVIGLGNMGSGLARNLLKNGFPTTVFDLDLKKVNVLAETGCKPAENVSVVGMNSDAVFVMVMNGHQAESVIFGSGGLAETMSPGGVIILTATIEPHEARAIGNKLADTQIDLIDSPVSGGFPGAQGGTLTLMAAGKDAVLDKYEPVMKAISKVIHRVGANPGDGQSMKACLQSLIGPVFTATFEAAALAAKAGIRGENFYDVVSSSSVGCGIVNNSLEKIIDRQFEGTGSHIDTMGKDLSISMHFAEALGVPMHSAATSYELFKAGKARFPDGDNWVVTCLIEEITGAELHR
ncbi:MAG: NAD(P)-dependent oxidoreductase [Rhodobacteraceae bacterium]|nr:NAD(P)-dependent oxidoreductase [Paracoccaceae bacterium]